MNYAVEIGLGAMIYILVSSRLVKGDPHRHVYICMCVYVILVQAQSLRI
jgi:hypothetical protein